MRRTVLLGIFVLLGLSQAAGAADPTAAITRANTSFFKGDYLKAVDHLQEALQVVWNKAPLAVRNVTFVAEQPEGYGQYQPRGEDVFEAVDPILLYCEPVGYTVVGGGNSYKFGLSADFVIQDESGQVLGGQEKFGQWQIVSRSFVTEFMMFFTLNLKGLPQGKYKLVVTLHDLNSDKNIAFDKPFAIR